MKYKINASNFHSALGLETESPVLLYPYHLHVSFEFRVTNMQVGQEFVS